MALDGRPDISRKPELGDREELKRKKPEFGTPLGEMVVVPAGEFLMGTTDEEARRVVAIDNRVSPSWMDREKPQHLVYLDEFAIDVYPVTVAQYREFCEAAGREMPRESDWGWLDDHPIVNVSWHDAAAYCEWAGKRLPTEAEWEKAARGTDGRIFPWGNEWNESAAHCDYKHNCEWSGKTAPVGSHPEGESPYGCHDMIGNVWEWCADRYDERYYARSPKENPRGSDSGTERVLRGGSGGAATSTSCAVRFGSGATLATGTASGDFDAPKTLVSSLLLYIVTSLRSGREAA